MFNAAETTTLDVVETAEAAAGSTVVVPGITGGDEVVLPEVVAPHTVVEEGVTTDGAWFGGHNPERGGKNARGSV